MQFGGGKAEAQCSSAVVKLTEYLPVTTQDDTASPSSCVPVLPNQPPTATTTTTEQVTHITTITHTHSVCACVRACMHVYVPWKVPPCRSCIKLDLELSQMCDCKHLCL